MLWRLISTIDSGCLYKDKNLYIGIMATNPSIDAIPDLDKLSTRVVEMLDIIEKNKGRDISETRIFLIDKFDDVPVSIIKLLTIDGTEEERVENLNRLLRLLENLGKAKSGKKELTQCASEFNDEIAERYVYPKFGGKENFEKKIEEDQNRDQN